MPKIYLFDATKPKTEAFNVIEVPPFRPASEETLKKMLSWLYYTLTY